MNYLFPAGWSLILKLLQSAYDSNLHMSSKSISSSLASIVLTVMVTVAPSDRSHRSVLSKINWYSSTEDQPPYLYSSLTISIVWSKSMPAI